MNTTRSIKHFRSIEYLKERFQKIRFAVVAAVSLFCLLATPTNNNANANMLNKFKKGFYFEKYKTAEEAKAALLELHPIGSDVEGLVKTLEGAGAKIGKDSLLDRKKFYKAPDSAVGVFDYSYKQKNLIAFLSSYDWGGGILYDKDRNIVNFGVAKHYMGL